MVTFTRMYFALLTLWVYTSLVYDFTKGYIFKKSYNVTSFCIDVFFVIGTICAWRLFYADKAIFQSDIAFDFTSIKSNLIFANVSIMWIIKIADLVCRLFITFCNEKDPI